jgi:predicted metalloprotease with PDZ domain
MHYTLSYSNPDTHFLHVAVRVENLPSDSIDVQLPAWRPGRYELANFAKNLTRLTAVGSDNQPRAVQKLTKDRWRIDCTNTQTLTIQYQYYAQQMDAGGSWLDAHLLYVNPVNCLIYVEGRQEEPCQVQLQIPDNYRVAWGLSPAPKQKRTWRADTYYQLVDSPLIASPTLAHYSYESAVFTFHLWVQGQCPLDWAQVLADFRAFTEVQVDMMAGFPVSDYHFLFHWLPYPHYHGVEHYNSTVITLGSYEQAAQLYPDMLGIASHELFHTWNVIRIRPKELMPYDFTRENYFSTGFVAEGITTYYGDLFLARAGVFTREAYLQELNVVLNKHFMHSNGASLSLLESSIDLWVDGYTAGVPNRKSSIYHKGALVALILDLEIRQQTRDSRSLDDVMRQLWEQFGLPGIGYTLDDYRQVVAEVAGTPQDSYFEECITGTIPLQNRLREALTYVGCELHERDHTPETGNLTVQIQVKKQLSHEEHRRLVSWLGKAGA